MKTALITAPATTPVSVSEAKAQANVTVSTDDTIIGVYLKAAVSGCEQILQRKLITQTWKAFFDYWPGHIVLPFGNLQSVTHVKYTDEDGTQYTFDSSKYTVDTVSVPGRVVLKSGETWPADTLFNVNPIEVQFVTGYGATSASIPDDIRTAILMTITHFYQNRESFLVNDSNKAVVEEIPMTARTLLKPYRVWEWVI